MDLILLDVTLPPTKKQGFHIWWDFDANSYFMCIPKWVFNSVPESEDVSYSISSNYFKVCGTLRVFINLTTHINKLSILQSIIKFWIKKEYK